MSELVTFDSTSLLTVRGLDILSTDPHRPPNRDLTASEIAGADESSVSSGHYKNRKIHVIGSLSRTNKSDLQQGLRELEALLQGIEKALVFPIAGTNTEFTATKHNIALSETAGGFTEFDIEFFCSNPMGYNQSTTTLYNYSALVGSAYSFAVTWSGNVKQQPVITVTLNSLLGGTNKTITIGNSSTSESITVTRTWSAADILIINSKTKAVTLNGAVVDYSGHIPEWTGTQPITYSDDLSARNIAVNIVYQQRNL